MQPAGALLRAVAVVVVAVVVGQALQRRPDALPVAAAAGGVVAWFASEQPARANPVALGGHRGYAARLVPGGCSSPRLWRSADPRDPAGPRSDRRRGRDRRPPVPGHPAPAHAPPARGGRGRRRAGSRPVPRRPRAMLCAPGGRWGRGRVRPAASPAGPGQPRAGRPGAARHPPAPPPAPGPAGRRRGPPANPSGAAGPVAECPAARPPGRPVRSSCAARARPAPAAPWPRPALADAASSR